jgi:hypothetical protein
LPGHAAYVEGKSYWQTDQAEVKSFMADLGRPPRSAAVPAVVEPESATRTADHQPDSAAAAGAVKTKPSAAGLLAPPAPAGTPPVRAALPQSPAVAAPTPVREKPSGLTQPRPPAETVKLPPGPQPVVRILNGCGVDGVCKTAAERLTLRRVRVQPKDITNAPAFNFAVTVIKTNQKNLPWARGIAKMLGLEEGRIQIVPGRYKYPTVTVVVGQDYAEWLR